MEPTREQLAVWRVLLVCAFALIDILDAELQDECAITLLA
jgi:predicted outer membrane lipoprotein